LDRTDFNEDLDGNSFGKTRNVNPVLDEWKSYVREEFGQSVTIKVYVHALMKLPFQDMDEDDDETGDVKQLKTGGKKRIRKACYSLEMDDDGKPIIPDFSELNLETKKAIIRAFLTCHYSMFCAYYPE